MEERHLAKVEVAGSKPVSRSTQIRSEASHVFPDHASVRPRLRVEPNVDLDEAQRVLDTAEAAAEQSRYRVEPVLLQARDVGAALVDEATERGADMLILGLPYRKRFGGDFAMGRTIPYVLKNAPCAVWVVREPMLEEQP